jgi:hypothetical protein
MQYEKQNVSRKGVINIVMFMPHIKFCSFIYTIRYLHARFYPTRLTASILPPTHTPRPPTRTRTHTQKVKSEFLLVACCTATILIQYCGQN